LHAVLARSGVPPPARRLGPNIELHISNVHTRESIYHNALEAMGRRVQA